MTIRGAGSDIVREQLQKIYDERGALVAGEVVEAASAEDHPLHAFFQWDDEEAARAHRIDQARALIRSVKIKVRVMNSTDPGEFTVRAWTAARTVGDGSEAAGTYVPTASLSPVQQQLQLQQMNRELNAMRVRYGHLAVFWESLGKMHQENAQTG